MDPEHATFLTAQRLARRLTGHTDRCGCQECTLYGKLLGSDKGLRRVLMYLHQDCHPDKNLRTPGHRFECALDVMRELAGETP